MDAINWLTENWSAIVAIVGGMVTVASIIVKLTPSQTDDEWLASIRGVLEKLALNSPPTKAPAVADAKPVVRPPPPKAWLLPLLVVAGVLAGCAEIDKVAPAPAYRPPGVEDHRPQLALACREAAYAVQQARALRSQNALSQAGANAAVAVIEAIKRPCLNQDTSLPSDLERIRQATAVLNRELAI